MPILTLTTSVAMAQSKQEKIAQSLSILMYWCLHKNNDLTMVNIVSELE